MESRVIGLDQEDFFYQDAAAPVIKDILSFISKLKKPGQKTFQYVWDYPIDPDVWFDLWEDVGYALYEIEVKVRTDQFDEGHPGWNIDGEAGFTESSEARIDIDIQLSPEKLGDSEVLEKLRIELYNVVPHEMHHLTQKDQPFQRVSCPLTNSSSKSVFHYFTSSCEVPAFVVGFRGESYATGRPVKELMSIYLDNQVKARKMTRKEAEETQRTWLSHSSWGGDNMSETVLREYVRNLLTEITELPKEYYTVIDKNLKDSRFWEDPNGPEDVDIFMGGLATDAAAVLQDSLQKSMKELDLDIDVIVRSHETDDYENFTLHPGHPAWPNRWLIDAKWYVSKEGKRKGRNTIDLEIMTSEPEHKIEKHIDVASIVRHIAQTVRHELVHYSQMKKQSQSRNLDDASTFQAMLDDPSQVPAQSDPKYNKGGSFNHKLWAQDYLRSHIEIDAHAHDAAEDLLAVYGEKGALEGLRTGFDLSDRNLPNAVRHYYETLPTGDSTIDRFKSKIYSYIQQLKKV